MMQKKVGFVCFGEVNTPIERLHLKHDEALAQLRELDYEFLDAGLVIDDPEYKTADAAAEKLRGVDMSCLIVCIAGWIPTHAVIRVIDPYRHIPVLLWGLSAWWEKGRLVTTACQAGTTAVRPTLEALGYDFKYVYSVIDKPWPKKKTEAFLQAACAKRSLRGARVGTMGYRDMFLYGTQFEGNSMRSQIGVEVEPYEMLEMVQTSDTVDAARLAEGVAYIRKNWVFENECDDAVLARGVRYALAILEKIRSCGWEAVSLIDVNGMKKLLGFPPAMIFMMLEYYCDILCTPENDITGSVTQLIMHYLSGQHVAYLEYYEFFEDSMLIGVPDFVPKAVTDGDVTMRFTAFGLFDSAPLNVSKVKPGFVTCSRLAYVGGRYKMHVYTAEAKTPLHPWNEFGWDDPAPQPPSLQLFPVSCTVEEFAEKVYNQHVIITYGDYTESLKDFCKLMNIDFVS